MNLEAFRAWVQSLDVPSPEELVSGWTMVGDLPVPTELVILAESEGNDDV